MDVDGQGAVVFGGAAGKGLALAQMLAQEGADITLLDRDGRAAAQQAAELLGHSQICDIAEEEAIAAGITTAMARFGQAPRVVINTVWFNPQVPFLGVQGKVSMPLIRHAMALNVTGLAAILSYGAQGMMDLPPLSCGARGVIAALIPTACDGDPALSACTAAARGLVDAAAIEFAARGIRVVALDPAMSVVDQVAQLLNRPTA